MGKIAITGGNGFLGFHVRAAAREYGFEVVPIKVGTHFSIDDAVEALQDVDSVIHIAGVNRGTDDEVYSGNILFAEQLGKAIQHAPQVRRVVFANSIQAGNGSVYGSGKLKASKILESYTAQIGADYKDLLLPNLFGEFGRPFYNSVVATFSYQVANDESPKVENDKKLNLLHAQDAAEYLLGLIDEQEMDLRCEEVLVSEVRDLLIEFAELYFKGEFPDLSTKFRRDLFNTFRSQLFPSHAPIQIARHADDRGAFFEIVRSNGGTGQTSFSTTEPGVTRGDHFHRRKVERFTVLSGKAKISLRKIFSKEVYEYMVTGDSPISVDMPTFYTHKIENMGQDVLYTAFWTNDIFNPSDPDTIVEAV